ncbi:MAG: hypothetical protein C3F06_13490 [Candidatus Methanoperedenaceae archaeon]|nr:MAG: hypothetical protein C3F06_13490 [Candidatus Methanoperedenaceae archaeon]
MLNAYEIIGEDMKDYMKCHINKERIWTSYDKDADVLYINFKKPSHADDSELTDDDILIRYEKGEIVGITILNASKRK